MNVITCCSVNMSVPQLYPNPGWSVHCAEILTDPAKMLFQWNNFWRGITIAHGFVLASLTTYLVVVCGLWTIPFGVALMLLTRITDSINQASNELRSGCQLVFQALDNCILSFPYLCGSALIHCHFSMFCKADCASCSSVILGGPGESSWHYYKQQQWSGLWPQYWPGRLHSGVTTHFHQNASFK